MEEVIINPKPSVIIGAEAEPILEDKYPDLEVGDYSLTKSQVHVDGRFFHTQKKFDISVHVLTTDDPYLDQYGFMDAVSRTNYKTGDKVILATYTVEDDQRTTMQRMDSFFMINSKLEERHFIPREDHLLS